MVKRKVIKHTSRQCHEGGEFEVSYDEHFVPLLTCNSCGKVIDDWRRWFDTYRTYWEQEARWAERRDLPVCILGYFCAKYEEAYGTTYTMDLSESGLFMGKDMYMIRRLMRNVASEDFNYRLYVDWIFAEKVEKTKKKILGLSFLTVAEIINDFKISQKRNRIYKRDTKIPDKVLAWVDSNAPSIREEVSLRDMGELNLAIAAYKAGALICAADFKKFLDKLCAAGVIDNTFKIKNWSER